MPKTKDSQSPIETYLHTKEERLSNPSVGMVTSETEHYRAEKTFPAGMDRRSESALWVWKWGKMQPKYLKDRER